MHRLPSKSTVHRFRGAAALVCAVSMLATAGFLTIIYSMLEDDRELTLIGAGIGLAAVLSMVLLWMISGRTRCPLCMTPVLAHNGCAKHRRSRALLGSHRLPVALSILFRGNFVCPYCNEKTVVAARQRQRARL